MRRSPLPRRTTPLRRTPFPRSPRQLSSLPLHRRVRPVGGRTPDPVGRETRQAVKARSGLRCEIAVIGCSGLATDLHHRQRRGMGDHRAVNALSCCRQCHAWTHANPALAKVAGWIVPPWADPALVPVWLRCRARVWLTEQGYATEAAA